MKASARQVEELLSRPLEERMVAVIIDGVGIAGENMVCALG